MSNSVDSFLFSIFIVLIPSIALLIGTIIFSNIVIKRYSKTISRLYKMNFNSLETERKRIANDLHDQFSYKMSIINKSIEQLTSNLNLQNNEDILIVKGQIRLFHNDIAQIIEAIHPRDLMDGKWRNSLVQLAEELSIGNTKIHLQFHTHENPKEEHLHNLYRIIQEKLSNIITHTHSNRIQIDIHSENSNIHVCIVYKSDITLIQKVTLKLGSKRGRGLIILNDRLKIIKATNSIAVSEGNIIDTITIPL